MPVSDGSAALPSRGRDSGRRGLRRIAAALVTLTVLFFFANIVDVWRVARSGDGPLAGTEEARAAIVLGAAQYNGLPSPVLAARLDRAAELYLAGAVTLVVVTGGSGEGDRTTEAKAGYDHLRGLGIPDEDLRLEVDGTSTYESVAASARFLRREGVVAVVVVTDPYHARRSQLVANEVGLDAEVATTSRDVTMSRVVREGLAVAVGRLIGFRRLDRIGS